MQNFGYVGKRVRQERLKYGLSLSELASATELSPSMLSQLENGKVNPSLRVLHRLASYFGIHIAVFFEEENSDDKVTVFRKNEQIEIGSGLPKSLRFLLPRSYSVIEPVLIVLQPQMDVQNFTVHTGLEFGFVLQGKIQVQFDGYPPADLEPEDSIIYEAKIPHRLVNGGTTVARGIWVGVPATS